MATVVQWIVRLGQGLAEIAGRDEELTVEISVPCVLWVHEASAVSIAENMKKVHKLTAVSDDDKRPCFCARRRS